MTPSLPTSLGWLIPVFLAAGLMLFLSSCGCCGERSCHPKNAPCPACFEERPMRGVKRTYPVNIAPAQGHAKGRVVLLLHELNGQSPGTLWLAKELADAGCKVYVPRLFGGYGSDHALRYVLPLLLSPDWKFFSAADVGPIRAEVAALAEAVAKENPGRKITVIGSCMTGGLPLDLLPSEHVDTAIVCQPALPFLAWSDARKTSFGLPQESVARAVEALEKQPHKRLIQFNYLGDRVGIIERTQHLAQQTQHGSAAKRHEMYIGVGPKDGSYSRTPGAKALPLGAHALYTETAQKMRGNAAHSTVTGAAGEDLQIYRRQLFQALGLTPPARFHGQGQ